MSRIVAKLGPPVTTPRIDTYYVGAAGVHSGNYDRARADAIAPRGPSLTPEEINPGLAPGMDASPQGALLPTSPAGSINPRLYLSVERSEVKLAAIDRWDHEQRNFFRPDLSRR